MIIYWYLSNTIMTVCVGVYEHSGIICVGPPIVSKFIGQHIDNLRMWMKRKPQYTEKIY